MHQPPPSPSSSAPPRTVFSFLRRAVAPTCYRVLSDDDVAVAQKMYEAGQSLAVIGEHFGVADRTVLNVFAEPSLLHCHTEKRGVEQVFGLLIIAF